MDADSRSFILVVFLYVVAAYCALTETAIASVSKNRIKVASERGDSRAKRVMYVLDHFDTAVTTLLICTNIAHISAASVITVYVTRRWGLNAVTASTILSTIATFFLAEMLPKSIGKKASEQCSMFSCGLLMLLMKVFRPLSKLLEGIGSMTLKSVKAEEEISVTEDELYDIIEDMEEEGTLDEEQSDLISAALQFGDVTVSSILTPRVDLAGIDINCTREEALAFVREQTHSRVVIYDKTIDNIVGVLQIRKFLKHYIASGEIPGIRDLMDNVYYAHQSMQIDELLADMSKNKLNMAVVLDAYGGTLGIVTIEDILEEIVGEIWDEDDVIKEPIVELANGMYLVSGDETVLDTFDFIGFEDPDKENEDRFTNLLIADWIYEQLAAIPKRGDSFVYNNLKISVNEINHNRIMRATVAVLEPAAEEVTV